MPSLRERWQRATDRLTVHDTEEGFGTIICRHIPEPLHAEVDAVLAAAEAWAQAERDANYHGEKRLRQELLALFPPPDAKEQG